MTDQQITDQITDQINPESLKARKQILSFGKSRLSRRIGTSDQQQSLTQNEYYRAIETVQSLFPEGLRQESQTLIQLLKDYYRFLHETNFGNIQADLHDLRDIDHLSKLQSDQVWFYELARTFLTQNLAIDKRIFLKYASTLYREKGSITGIKSFFRILFNEDVSVYFPWEDVIIASNGEWDGTNQYRISLDGVGSELKGFTLSRGEFKTNDSFLSDTQYLQDSYYYQQYSYDIKASISEKEWINLFKIILHPVGYILFSTFLLTIFSKTGRVPASQSFGYIESPILRLLILIIVKRPVLKHTIITYLSSVISSEINYSNRSWIFYSETPIEGYPDTLTFNDLTRLINLSPDSRITIKTPSMVTNALGEVLTTDEGIVLVSP